MGTEEQRAKYLPGITSGKTVCALAITEPGVGSDMSSINTRAVRDGEDWVINGSKTYITNGVYGDLYFVAARTRETGRKHQQLSLFLVEDGSPGLSVSKKLSKTGMWASDTAELVFDGVRVSGTNLLGQEGEGFYHLVAGLQRERLLSAVLCISAADQTLTDTVEFLGQRQAFGKSLSNIVYMGMGEPLLNYNNMLESIGLITTKKGMGMSPKRITVSTAGIAKMVKKLGDDMVKFNLAISLHSANDEKRSSLMILNDSVPLQELRDAIRYFYDKIC